LSFLHPHILGLSRRHFYFAQSDIITLPLQVNGWSGIRDFPGSGFCVKDEIAGATTVKCVSPFTNAAAYRLRFQPSRGDAPEIEIVSGLTGPGASKSLFSIWQPPAVALRYPNTAGVSDVYLETREPVAHFERELNVLSMHLAGMPMRNGSLCDTLY